MAVSRRSFLLSGAAAGLAAGLPAGAVSGAGGKPKYLIVIVAEGGWDVTFAFDPKLGVSSIQGPEVDETGGDDVEAIQTFSGIELAVNEVKRPNVSRWFETWADHAQVVNGIWTGSIAHDPCRFRVLTGTSQGSKPDAATIVGFVNGDSEPLGTVDLSGWSLSGHLAASAGRIGYQSQITALIDPNTRFSAPAGSAWSYPLFEMTEPDADAVSDWLRTRANAFRGTVTDGGNNDLLVDDLLDSWDRGDLFSEQSANILDSLQLGKRANMALQITIAVDLLAQGMCRTVTLDTRHAWDTHDFNNQQHGFFDDLFDHLDLLATELQAAGMLDQTLVAVVSEMTRTPKLNVGQGKDHWPHTSALFFGGGIRGGVKTGATDELLESLPVDLQTGEPFTDRSKGSLLKYDSLAAGILELMDVDPQPWLPGTEPFRGLAS